MFEYLHALQNTNSLGLRGVAVTELQKLALELMHQ
jgi:hypothetical protein